MGLNIIWIIVLAALFVLVWLNHKRNMKKLRGRNRKDFYKGYQSKRKHNLE